jgi:hypothetical protein
MKKTAVAIIAAVLLIAASQAKASILLVSTSTASNNASASSITSTLASVVSGNLIVAFCAHGTTFVNPTNVTDTFGSSFTNFALASNSNAGAISGYYATSSGSGSDTVGCNFASSVGGRAFVGMQYGGIAASSPLDATAFNGTTTALNPYPAGPFSTVQANEVIVAAMGTANLSAPTAGTGYALEATSTRGSTSSLGAEDQTVTSTQSGVSSTFGNTANSSNMMVVGTFRAASSAATSSAAKPNALFFAGD